MVLQRLPEGSQDLKKLKLDDNTIEIANDTISCINKKLDLEIGLLQAQNLDEEEQDLRGWKQILEKKCLVENANSRNKEIQLVLEKQDHSQKLITEPKEVMFQTKKHF
ncbi:21990_t:CDS:2 [Gigaspora margarita]|uniref:21990_t:CDS:1 n=1 Tax=Gigaspora margarita TaxID=4874 RepID=A0ABN7VHK5_GIGMA|nr:21990_t:CDS:2 [Gigaspora margarita]